MDKINYRNSFLSLTCIGICLASVYSLIEPTVGNRPIAAFDFPDYIPLESWQLLKTTPIVNKKIEKDTEAENDLPEDVIASAKSYTYSKDDIVLTAEMRYFIGARASINYQLEVQNGIPKEILRQADIQNLDNIGFHTLFTYQNRAYLSSCINSRGGTTVTQKQFSKNRYVQDLNYNLLLPWLLGKESLRDRRCLLVNLSIPINNSQSTAYTILQSAWEDWYQWWQPNFPTL